ncbi:glutathione S-transferase family protein [Sphingobium sp. B2]|uniref:glutathione S-transferase family protein n=1 Tax=Sphingobium sp. B2 TaxID=2583228 RepID=UPI0011A7DBA1|nr:glutathione S-transferase N-terminal domain-containing protein [Sphingobium sp. B2]
MIEFHYVHTPNALKVRIMLEEVGLPFQRIDYDLRNGDHLNPHFRRLNPNNKLPVIQDLQPADGAGPVTVFESGAILIYLAEKTGQLLSSDARVRTTTLQWLMWQMAGLGPMLGQFAHFARYSPEGQPYALDRYTRELGRLLNVLEYRLGEAEFLAGIYSIADIASFPIASGLLKFGYDLSPYPQIERWITAISVREAVMRADDISGIPARVLENPRDLSAEEWSNLYGDNMINASRGVPD